MIVYLFEHVKDLKNHNLLHYKKYFECVVSHILKSEYSLHFTTLISYDDMCVNPSWTMVRFYGRSRSSDKLSRTKSMDKDFSIYPIQFVVL